ncbi:TetR/AcrR family transcriptional regulator [Spiractinospora alimapuensis]|uniref:TetR/AcrR family transcriptional regulator n=1 Tax=Spiractinospora alimapuensis TaxID=2820884 RepID=UPI002ED3DD5C
MQDIVGAAGLTKGAMYHYFDSKDDLLYEIYARIIRQQRARLETIAGASDAPVGRVRTAAEDFVVTTVQNLDEVWVFLTAAHRLRSDQRRGVETERRRFHDTFTALIAEGQESGAFRDDIPADLVVHQFVGSVHHLGTWYDPTGPLPPPTLAAHYAELLVSGIEQRDI